MGSVSGVNIEQTIYKEFEMNHAKLKQDVSMLVKESIVQQINNTAPIVNENVAQYIRENSNEFESVMVNEGLGSAIAKGFGAIGGGIIGAKLGGIAGGGIGATIGILLGLGFGGPLGAIVGLKLGGLAGSGAGALTGIIKGGPAGYRMARKHTDGEHGLYTAKLIKVTEKRDDLITELAENPENPGIQSRIDALTQKQQVIGRELSKALEFALRAGKIDKTEYQALDKIAMLAIKGKFSYLADRKK